MPEKAQWEIEHLKKKADQHEIRLNKQDEKISVLQSFKYSTVEKLITIFNSIDEMKEDSRWMRKTFITTLVGGIVTVIGSLLVWLITS